MNEKDFALELGYLGFTMRLKRLSDALMHDGKRMYKQLGTDIESNWYVIFRLLKAEGELSVMEIADQIRLAHPSVISLTNKMIKAGYLSSVQCSEDSRKRLLSLTEKALNKLPQFEEIWRAGEKSIIEVLEGTEMIKDLEIVEKRFADKGFRERTIGNLQENNESKPTTN